MFDIPDELIAEYVRVPVCLLPEYCKNSNHFIIAYADGGNNFLDYGITKGSEFSPHPSTARFEAKNGSIFEKF